MLSAAKIPLLPHEIRDSSLRSEWHGISWEALIKSKCADWRTDFSAVESGKTQEYFVYFKFFSRRQTGNMPSRRARRFSQRFPTPRV
jgi:hypothetical protein